MQELAAYHNSIESPFSGIYPHISPAWKIEQMRARLGDGRGFLCVAAEGGELIGFVYASITERVGEVAMLYVKESARGKQYGGALLQKALRFFGRKKVSLIDIRVLDGNPAATFYEKYGFKKRSVVLSRLGGASSE